MIATLWVRMAVNLAITALMPLLMSYSLIGETAHEWLGIAILVLFVLHHLQNPGWYRGLFRGRCTAYRAVLTILNTLLFVDFLLLFYSGIDLSKHLLPFLPELGSASLSRVLHLSASHWGLALTSVHLGLHMSRFCIVLKKHRRLSIIMTGLARLAALYGCYSFITMNFTSYLLPTSSFLFFDASQPLWKLLTKMVSVMILFAYLGHTTVRLIQHQSIKNRSNHMKKLLSLLLCTGMLFGLSACTPNAPGTSAQNVKPSAEAARTLVVYFSMPETTKADNLTTEEENSVVIIDGEVLGNTQYAAYVIQENTGADIFRIEPQIPYTTSHEALVDQAKEEQNQNARPTLSANVENLSQYDTIFIGYPNWWGDMPMILYTFFDENDFSGKTIIPFNTHGGSGFSGTIDTIAELEPNATVNKEGYTVSRNSIHEAGPDIISWLKELGYQTNS